MENETPQTFDTQTNAASFINHRFSSINSLEVDSFGLFIFSSKKMLDAYLTHLGGGNYF